MTDIAFNIGSLPALPTDGLDDADLIEIERPRLDPAPNDNYRATAAQLRSALDAQVGDVLVTTRALDDSWVEQGSHQHQSAYPALFAQVGLLQDRDAPDGALHPIVPQLPPFRRLSRQVIWLDGFHLVGRALHVSGGQTADILHSHDGGLTWTLGTPVPHEHYSFITKLDASTLLLHGNNINDVSTDGGQTWQSRSVPIEEYAATILPFSRQRFLAFAPKNGGTHALSTDGGETWTADYAGINIKDYFVFGPMQALAHTHEGSWKVTADGGLTWTDVPIPMDVSYHTVLSPGVALIASQKVILRTDDGGLTWTETYRITEHDNYVKNVLMFDAQWALLLTTHFLLLTSDAGQTWERVSGTWPSNNIFGTSIPEVGLYMTNANGLYWQSYHKYLYAPLTHFKVPHVLDVHAPLKAHLKGR